MRWNWATNWSTDGWSILSCRLTAHHCTRQQVVDMWTWWNCWCNIKPHWIHMIRWAHELWNASLSRGLVCLWAEQAYCTLLRSSTQTWCSRGSLARGRWHGEWRSVYRQGVVGERRRLLFWPNILITYWFHSYVMIQESYFYGLLYVSVDQLLWHCDCGDAVRPWRFYTMPHHLRTCIKYLLVTW